MEPYRILVVDDEDSIRMVLKLDLEQQDYHVELAVSGKEALEKLGKADFDLMITDLSMKEIDGLELIHEASKIKPEIMVIMLTAYGTLDSAIKAMRLGVYDYLCKPYEKSDLYLRVSNALEKLELKRKVKLYEKILIVCCVCGMFNDDMGKAPGEGKWLMPENYLEKRAGVKASHTYCPICLKSFLKDEKF